MSKTTTRRQPEKGSNLVVASDPMSKGDVLIGNYLQDLGWSSKYFPPKPIWFHENLGFLLTRRPSNPLRWVRIVQVHPAPGWISILDFSVSWADGWQEELNWWGLAQPMGLSLNFFRGLLDYLCCRKEFFFMVLWHFTAPVQGRHQVTSYNSTYRGEITPGTSRYPFIRPFI